MVDKNPFLSETLPPYQNFEHPLKSKDVPRQYPSLLNRFLNFLELQGDMEEKCNQLYVLGKENKIRYYNHGYG